MNARPKNTIVRDNETGREYGPFTEMWAEFIFARVLDGVRFVLVKVS